MLANDLSLHMLRTYSALRRLMAFVTFSFLVLLVAYRTYGNDSYQRDSISAYYYHDNNDFRMKDIFIGSLVSVGFLLIAYQGYTSQENWLLNAAGFFLLGVVCFPMDWPTDNHTPMSMIGWVHSACAVLFFGSLLIVCWFRAQDTLVLVKSAFRRKTYSIVYRFIGLLMFCAPVLALFLHYVGAETYVFSVEWFGVFVFLIYWVTKSLELYYTQLETPRMLNEFVALQQSGHIHEAT